MAASHLFLQPGLDHHPVRRSHGSRREEQGWMRHLRRPLPELRSDRRPAERWRKRRGLYWYIPPPLPPPPQEARGGQIRHASIIHRPVLLRWLLVTSDPPQISLLFPRARSHPRLRSSSSIARGGPTPVSLCQFRRADFNRSDAVMSLVCHVDVPCFRTESGRWNPQADGSTVAIEFSSEKGRPSRRGSRHAPNRRFDGGKLTEVIRFAWKILHIDPV